MDQLLKISCHLTEEFINEKLTDWFGENVKLQSYRFGEGTGKGDSYLSDTYRITFHGKLENAKTDQNPDVSLRVIIKCLPANISRRKTFRSVDFFKNEINFYQYVLSALIEFQSSKDDVPAFDCCARLFAAVADGENDFIALEDLSVYNFTSATRQEGIDFDHARVILKRFAQFHAVSFAFKDQRPEKFHQLSKTIFETYYDEKYFNWYRRYWKRLCGCVIDAVEREYPNSIYVEKIKEFAIETTYFDNAKAVKDDGPSAVFSHGDSWTPNFLFKYKTDTNVPEDAKIIDFQLTRCASPVLDVSFFIYACTTQEMRKEHYQAMLDYYHDSLSARIELLGSDPSKTYPKTRFMEEIKKYSYFGLAFCMESVPTIILEPDDAFPMDAIEGTEAVDVADIWAVETIEKQSGRLRLAGNVVHAVDNGFI